MKKIVEINVEKLNKEKFLPFGEIIEAKGDYKIINQGNGKKWNNLVNMDMYQDEGKVNLGILRTKILEFTFSQMERHLFTSQIFVPLGGGKSIVAVAPVSEYYPNPDEVKAFIMNGNQGISFNRKVWHHSLFPIKDEQEYILMMRGGDFPPDVELVSFPENVQVKIKI